LCGGLSAPGRQKPKIIIIPKSLAHWIGNGLRLATIYIHFRRFSIILIAYWIHNTGVIQICIEFPVFSPEYSNFKRMGRPDLIHQPNNEFMCKMGKKSMQLFLIVSCFSVWVTRKCYLSPHIWLNFGNLSTGGNSVDHIWYLGVCVLNQ